MLQALQEILRTPKSLDAFQMYLISGCIFKKMKLLIHLYLFLISIPLSIVFSLQHKRMQRLRVSFKLQTFL